MMKMTLSGDEEERKRVHKQLHDKVDRVFGLDDVKQCDNVRVPQTAHDAHLARKKLHVQRALGDRLHRHRLARKTAHRLVHHRRRTAPNLPPQLVQVLQPRTRGRARALWRWVAPEPHPPLSLLFSRRHRSFSHKKEGNCAFVRDAYVDCAQGINEGKRYSISRLRLVWHKRG